MLDLAADFGVRNNLEFSCDPDPVKTKSKAIYMVGKKTTLVKPVNRQLYRKPLPWVTHATHLGHEFHKDGTMAMDARMKRGSYIGKSLEVMDSFNFAAPPRSSAPSSSLPPTFTAGCSGGLTVGRPSRSVAAGTPR